MTSMQPITGSDSNSDVTDFNIEEGGRETETERTRERIPRLIKLT